MLVQGIDNDFLETLGIELVAGRNAEPTITPGRCTR